MADARSSPAGSKVPTWLLASDPAWSRGLGRHCRRESGGGVFGVQDVVGEVGVVPAVQRDPERPVASAPMSTTLSPAEAAEAVARPILEIGRTWMQDLSAAPVAERLGLAGPFGLWTVGRAGVMGEAEASAVAAAIGFMAPDKVMSIWEIRDRGVPAWDVALAYAEHAARWGREAFVGLDPAVVARCAELGGRVAGATLPSISALFAGWRTVPLPGDPSGDATVVLQTLREMRGGAHLAAVHAVGLGPHAAIMSTDDPIRGGSKWAETFGWTAPHPDGDNDARLEAERLTTVACAPGFGALTEDERREFVDVVATMRAAIDG